MQFEKIRNGYYSAKDSTFEYSVIRNGSQGLWELQVAKHGEVNYQWVNLIAAKRAKQAAQIVHADHSKVSDLWEVSKEVYWNESRELVKRYGGTHAA